MCSSFLKSVEKLIFTTRIAMNWRIDNTIKAMKVCCRVRNVYETYLGEEGIPPV